MEDNIFSVSELLLAANTYISSFVFSVNSHEIHEHLCFCCFHVTLEYIPLINGNCKFFRGWHCAIHIKMC